MAHLIDKDALVAEINQRIEDYKSHKIDDSYHNGLIFALEDLRDDFLDTLEVKEVDVSSISENMAEAYEYLDFTHTSNLAHNKPMVAARLRKAIKELHSVGLFQLTHDEKYRMENLGLKAQKGEKV